MEKLIINKTFLLNAFFYVVSLFCLTFLRKSLLIIYPIFVLSLFYLLNLKFTLRQISFSLIFLSVSAASAIIEGFINLNYFISTFLILPIFLFLTSRYRRSSNVIKTKHFKSFFKKFTYLLIFVNVTALIYSQFFISSNQNYEDAFTGVYGGSGFGAHTLSIINFLVCVYFFFTKSYLKFLFFLVSGILGFYGLGLIIFILAFSTTFIYKMRKYWRTALKVIFSVIIIGYSIFIFNPKNFTYINKNINYAKESLVNYNYSNQMDKANNMQITRIPRFITFVVGSIKLVSDDFKVLLLGTSPGGYNSRTAFLFNGDFMSNKFLKENFNNRTVYHSERVFPLLNRTYLKRPYNDGTRNQTFSSIISVLVEYGVLIGGILIFWFFSKARNIVKVSKTANPNLSQYANFLSIFLFILFLFQNYLEYPEIMLPAIIILKLIEIDSLNEPLHDS